ncbi:MAG: hypothetical protein V6Z81_11305 [Parvularculales bacterium]
MKNLTAMTFAIMTAFAFSGPAVFTVTTANAADEYKCYYGGDCGQDEGERRQWDWWLIEDPETL